MKFEDYVDVPTAAKLLGHDTQYTRLLCKLKKLPAQKFAGRWWLLRAAVEERAKERHAGQ